MPLKPISDDAIQLNLTPMIDVLFLLIIFFMVATEFSQAERSVDLELPKVGEAGTNPSPPTPHIVQVTAAGDLLLDGQVRTPDELTAALAELVQQSVEVDVVVHGDATSQFQHVATALAQCRAAGVTRLGITVEAAAALARNPTEGSTR